MAKIRPSESISLLFQCLYSTSAIVNQENVLLLLLPLNFAIDRGHKQAKESQDLHEQKACSVGPTSEAYR